MKRRQEMIATIIVLGLASAMQASKARELPDEIERFAAEQYEQIRVQGTDARQAILKKLRTDYEAQEIAFMESQGRSILGQGRTALASIQENFRGNRIAGLEAYRPGNFVAVRRRGGDVGRGPSRTRGRVEAEVRLVRLDGLMAWTRPGRVAPVSAPGSPGQSEIGS